MSDLVQNMRAFYVPKAAWLVNWMILITKSKYYSIGHNYKCLHDYYYNMIFPIAHVLIECNSNYFGQDPLVSFETSPAN